MGDKIRLRQAVVVEGKYDKIRLEALVDALILSTDGFGVFNDKELRALIRRLAQACGVVVLTDADAAGFRIRAFIADIARDGAVTHVYIPDIYGKEKRKARPGREGKLGVEGVGADILREAFTRAGLLGEDSAPTGREALTRADLYELGLTGGANCGALRRALLARLALPARLSTNAMLPVLGRLCTKSELESLVREIQDGNES